MQHDFWHQKWAKNEIGFHNQEIHPMLQRHFGQLGAAVGARIFLPLCGKTLDCGWLLSMGYRVVGAELSAQAIDSLFSDLGRVPTITKTGSLQLYQAQGLDVFVGDIFELDRERLGEVNAVYDRAALVALPHTMRVEYAEHVLDITRNAPQLLVAFDYDQGLLEGPPFSVPENEIKALYGNRCKIQLLESLALPGGLKGKVPAQETVWHLRSV